MSTSWKPQYRHTPPCQQQRKDEYLGMSPDIFGLVAGISVALLLAAMFLFPMYYMERHEQRGDKKKSQRTLLRSKGNGSYGDAMSFDITIGATRITHSQGYPSTKSELKAAETLINGLATLLNQSLKSGTPGMDDPSPPTTSCPSMPREQGRSTPLSPPCVCSSSRSPKGEESASEPSKVGQDVDEPSRKPDSDGGLSNVLAKKLACPFYQHDPDGQFRKTYCTGPGFSSVDEVRQQRKFLRRRIHGTQEQQWRAIYGILFPVEPSEDMPSPYFEDAPLNTDISDKKEESVNNAQQQQHFRLQLPHVLDRRLVENPTNSESETPTADSTTRNRRGENGDGATVDVVRGAQKELYRNFRPIRQLTIEDFYDSAPLSPGAPADETANPAQPDESRERHHSHDSSDFGVLTESSRSGSIQSSGFVYASDEFSKTAPTEAGNGNNVNESEPWRLTFESASLTNSLLSLNRRTVFLPDPKPTPYLRLAAYYTTSPSKRSSRTNPSTPPHLTMEDVPLEHGSPEHLLPPSWKTMVTAWLAEDTPSFDYGGFVVGAAPRTATLWGKSGGIVAGRPFVDEVFAQCGCTVEWHVKEGSHVELRGHGDHNTKGKMRVATVSGPTRGILLGERVALNTLARCSGVASMTRGMLVNLRAAGYAGVLAGTRKTTPGFRLVEKYGMLVGGADAHRHDLSSMIMLKDNHVWSKGSITNAVKAAKSVGGFSLKVEVEVQSEEEADEAIAAGADVVMLDNFTGEGVKIAAKSLKEKWAGKKYFLVEVSGGLTLENVENYVCNDVDIVSTSAIHQGVPHVDFSLKVEH
ncbi:nicotinate-nucleotide diphosphorylase [Colletotrichum lupini]|uniref:Nicotinate-nucleotide pyrophosphorylase [carboxylating] n=1 Tax=Colletotrichum lupini TaxID=145971 RepID=A0A9Q8SV23_9PEZI|nr:nicotinate-nucleotide diphosphorylase [Colletotrichum lupini]UQC83748.1 nicotinate-nucleotide diphosphorylase [Colletotrichum lupini]